MRTTAGPGASGSNRPDLSDADGRSEREESFTAAGNLADDEVRQTAHVAGVQQGRGLRVVSLVSLWPSPLSIKSLPTGSASNGAQPGKPATERAAAGYKWIQIDVFSTEPKIGPSSTVIWWLKNEPRDSPLADLWGEGGENFS